MDPWLYWICRAILLFDRLPACRRLYTVEFTDTGALEVTKKRWVWMKNGLWGFYMLRSRLLWDFIDESERRHKKKHSQVG